VTGLRAILRELGAAESSQKNLPSLREYLREHYPSSKEASPDAAIL